MDAKSKRLAKLVTELRDSQSQRKFANELGVSQSSIRLWESHQAWPDTNNLEKLAIFKGWTLSQLQAYLVRGDLPSEEPLDQVLKVVRSLPLHELAQVATVAVETLAERSTAKSQSGSIYNVVNS